jgi:hypothetical protein
MKKVGQWLQVQIVLSFSSLLKSPSHEFILTHCSGEQPSTFLPILQVQTQIIIGSNGPNSNPKLIMQLTLAHYWELLPHFI